MTDSIQKHSRWNKPLLLLILLLDLVGFSLIFPLIPDLLEFYTEGATRHPVDRWIFPFIELLRGLLPGSFQTEENLIVILGGILASIYSFLQFLFTPLWGKLSDRHGRRPILLITTIGLAVSYILWFMSTTFTFFMISRFFGGIMAGNLGVASAAMADMSKPEERTKAMGLLGAAFGLGFIIGPGIGGLAATWDMTRTFPGVSFLHPFSACAMISIILSGISALLNIGLFQETLAGRLMKKDPWMGPLRAFRLETGTPGFRFLLMINFLFLFLFSGFEFSLSFLYKLSYGANPGTIGLVFFFSGFVIVFGQGYLIRKLTGRLTEKTIALIGLVMMPLAMVLLPLSAPHFWLSLVWVFFISLGVSLIQPALSGMASLMSDPEHQGVALGAFRSAGSLARALGPLAGAIVYWTLGDLFAYAGIGVLLLLTFFLAMGLRRVSHKSPESKPEEIVSQI